MSGSRGKSSAIRIDVSTIAEITNEIKRDITRTLTESINRQITQQILNCVQQVLPSAVQQAINQSLPQLLQDAMQKAVDPLKNEINEMKTKLTALESEQTKQSQGSQDMAQRIGNIDRQISGFQKDAVSPNRLSTEQVKVVYNRVGNTVGGGMDIGIVKNYHIVVKKIPDKPEYDENWLKTHLTETLPETATVIEINKLTSANEERAKRTRSKTFKVVLAYSGDVCRIYSPVIYPRNAEIKRYRFLRSN